MVTSAGILVVTTGATLVVTSGGILVVTPGGMLVVITGATLVVSNGGILDVVLITGGTLVVVDTTEGSVVSGVDDVFGMLVIDGKASWDEVSELSCVAVDVVTDTIACREVVLA